MEKRIAISVLGAMAHDTRLDVVKRLVQAGPKGALAGEISEALGIKPNTLSNNLSLLANADLVRSQREGRTIRYFVRFDTLEATIRFLMEDCCGGQIGLCSSTPLTCDRCDD